MLNHARYIDNPLPGHNKVTHPVNGPRGCVSFQYMGYLVGVILP